MTIDWMDSIQSMFEMLLICTVIVSLDNGERADRKRAALMVFLSATITALINQTDIPYHALVTILIPALLTALLLKRHIADALSDAIVAFCFGLVVEMATEAVLLCVSHLLPESAVVVIRIIYLLLFTVLSRYLLGSRSVMSFLSRHYYPNRRTLLWLLVSIAVMATIIVNMYAQGDTKYQNARLEILILTFIYAVFNGLFIRNISKRREAEKELFQTKEYEGYLRKVLKEMSMRRHEYRNELQHIISLAETADPKTGGSDRIKEYAGDILKNNEMAASLISDDLTISVLLYQFSKDAKKKSVNLEWFIDRPVPSYGIPEKDMVELVTNAFNNAVESVENLPPERRNVFIKLQDHYIEVVNELELRPDVAYGVSTKGQGRGIGRINMERIAKRRGIKLNHMMEEGRYIVSMTFE